MTAVRLGSSGSGERSSHRRSEGIQRLSICVSVRNRQHPETVFARSVENHKDPNKVEERKREGGTGEFEVRLPPAANTSHHCFRLTVLTEGDVVCFGACSHC